MHRTLWTVVIGNLALFVALASQPAFQEIHHHWIFPLLAAAFGARGAGRLKTQAGCLRKTHRL